LAVARAGSLSQGRRAGTESVRSLLRDIAARSLRIPLGEALQARGPGVGKSTGAVHAHTQERLADEDHALRDAGAQPTLSHWLQDFDRAAIPDICFATLSKPPLDRPRLTGRSRPY
jgi:hypothetical protein